MHPIAFTIGGFSVHWYGVMVAFGFLAGLWTASRRALIVGVDGEKIYDLGPWLIVGTLVGARALYVITFWNSQFAGKPFLDVFKIWEGGLVFYGGLIGATIAAILGIRTKKLPLWRVADVLAPSIALGHAFGRVGCFLNGCCFGRVCNLPWAVRFPPGSDAWTQQYDANLIPATASALPVHPTEIYESLLNFGLYFALAWYFRKRKFDGQVFGTYLVSYAFIRAFVEMFRGDYPANQIHFGLTPAQMVSVPILVAGLILLWKLPRSSTTANGAR